MTNSADNTDDAAIERKMIQMRDDAEKSGYHLNQNEEFTKDLIKGILTNKNRYGFESCPCRLTIGNKEDNLDIICPCDYRDSDLLDFGCCYCALYVSDDVFFGKKTAEPIPDRRSDEKEAEIKDADSDNRAGFIPNRRYPILRCKVCGYLCAREKPPEKCPICKAGSERFEKYL